MDHIPTMGAYTEQTELNSTLPSTIPTAIFKIILKAPVRLLEDITDNTEPIPVETQMTKMDQYLESIDEGSITNIYSTNIAAVARGCYRKCCRTATNNQN